MSAEVLRSAARKLRIDSMVAYDRGHISMRTENFNRTVADLLDMDADSETPDDYDESIDIFRQYCLRVAHAYLGDNTH